MDIFIVLLIPEFEIKWHRGVEQNVEQQFPCEEAELKKNKNTYYYCIIFTHKSKVWVLP